MPETAISVENISKLYRLGEVGTGTLAHDLNRWWHKVRGKEDPYLKIGIVNDRSKKAEKEVAVAENGTPSGKSISAPQRFSVSDFSPDYVWALKEINFEVKQGELLGIIGRNGAGKSTLLKIMSRVTTPTQGRIKIKGRIASLLEVGTGFHPDLTGRDNIYLNGAILGMRKKEIDRKFDEIVDFAGVELYIDTPVKRYSSGMYVRLAFAVAAHLEPEILIVDEVLAVGDAEFQKKCLGKMQDVSTREGRTVIFVSHNMAAIKSLCEKAVYLDQGMLRKAGPVAGILKEYLVENLLRTGSWQRTDPLPASDGIYFEKAEIVNSGGQVTGTIDCADAFSLNLSLNAKRSFDDIQIAVRVTNQEGVAVFTTCNTDVSGGYAKIPAGRQEFRVKIPGHFLAPGSYSFEIAVHTPKVKLYDRVPQNLAINIEETGSIETYCRDGRIGIISACFQWERHPC